MSVEQSIRCDVCRHQKGEANKWFSCAKDALRFSAFNRKAARHICSEECAHRLLAAELQRVREKEASNG